MGLARLLRRGRRADGRGCLDDDGTDHRRAGLLHLEPVARNYGGSTQGLRWLFWLIPFWLLVLPKGVEAGQYRGWVRWLSLLALSVSVISVGYALRNPWTHPWILDALEHLGFYGLPR